MSNRYSLYIILLIVISFFSNESLLFLSAGGILLFTFSSFWRHNEPKFLLINLLLYWSVVSILIFYSAFIGVPINDLTRYGVYDIKTATWLALISLFVYVLAILLPVKKVSFLHFDFFKQLFSKYEGTKIILLYFFVSILSVLLNKSIIHIPGGQILLAVVYFKWVLLSFLILYSVINSHLRNLVILIIILEVILSFSGFWADFKNYFFIAIASYLFFNTKINWKLFLNISISLILLVTIAVIWSFSKGEYRSYLTGGERTQIIVEQNQISNIEKFLEIISKDFSQENFVDNYKTGLENLVYRISYVEFLAMTMKQVPTYLPHENGRLLQNAVEHILKPRILFPDKKPIYDSELTSKYTGRKFSGAEEGTSFSLGTVAEAYVDFGPIYMFVPIFIFGFWIGWMYKYFIVNGYNILWGMCYSAPIFQFAWSFPITTSKFLGWSVTYFITFWFINKYLIKYIDRWLLKPEYKA